MSDTTADEAPRDPAAPVRKTLPSGKIVEIRSHRSLNGLEVATAIGSQPGGPWMRNAVVMRNTLAVLLVTELEPGRSDAPALVSAGAPDGTLEAAKAFDAAMEALLAQRGDDYRAIYNAMNEAYNLTLGTSVIIDHDEYEDPKAPTTDGSEPEPSSADESQPSDTEPTGKTPPTTRGSRSGSTGLRGK